MTNELFPIQAERGAKPHPLRIPWSVAELAYSVYAGKYGKSQSLTDLASRGGFGPGEMDVLLPGWRERVDRLAALEAENARLAALVERLRTELLRIINGAPVHARSDHSQNCGYCKLLKMIEEPSSLPEVK